jgi:DNA-directed RNA polymerase specialized sigma24 family protein
LFGYESENAEAERRIKLQLPLQLHDVDDTQRFVSAIVSRSGLALSWSDREDLEQSLLVVAWEISLTYEPGRIHKGFSTWAGIILRRRITDWQRSNLGRTKWRFRNPDGSIRTYERERPQLVPFDDSALDRLEQSLAERDGDREAGGDLSFAGLDSEGDWQRARDLELLGLEAPG